MIIGFRTGGDEIEKVGSRVVRFQSHDLTRKSCILQIPFCGSKFFMNGYLAAIFRSQGIGQLQRVPLHHQVKIEAGTTQQQVPDEAADNIMGSPSSEASPATR